MSYTWCAQPRNNARIVRERREIWRTELSESGPACLRSWEDLVDVPDRDVARVGAVRVSATAKIHRELEHGHVEREVFGFAPTACGSGARAKTARQAQRLRRGPATIHWPRSCVCIYSEGHP